MPALFRRATLIAVFLFSLAGCGGGGGATVALPPKAVLQLSTQGSVAAKGIYGIDVTLQLPAGATLAADANGVPATGSVVASGDAQGGYLLAKYTPATASAAGSVHLVLEKSGGFDGGDFAQVNCDIPSGASPKGTDFTPAGFKAVDQDGNALAALSLRYTVALR